MTIPEKPTVLSLSGHDPSGGAGIQADIETINSMGAHALTVITALTIQNTQNVSGFESVSVPMFKQQINTLTEDISVNICKIGMTASPEIVEAIHQFLVQHPDIPVIFDPVLSAGGGGKLQSEATLAAIKEKLIPLTTLLTPNSIEARRLTNNSNDLIRCGLQLMEAGCQHVLLTGGHEESEHIDNLWFSEGQHRETFSWERLAGEFHGSGCTLASACAAMLAHGLAPFDAVNEAQEYAWNTLKYAYRVSENGQLIPNRFFWTEEE